MNLSPKNWTGVKKVAAVTFGAGALVASLVLLVAAAWPESSATAKANFCNSLDSFASAIVSYQGLDPATATNAELDSAADNLSSAWDDVVDDAEDWANAYDNPLGEAYDDLYWATQVLPDDNTVAEDLDSLQPELSAFPQAFHKTFDGSGCA
jgi:hypothetical protein